MEKLYYTAKEVAEMLDVSVSHAYKVIREANRELSSKGFYVRAGRVSRKYLDSKLEMAKQFLREQAQKTQKILSTEIIELAVQEGISKRTLETAKKELKIKAEAVCD